MTFNRRPFPFLLVDSGPLWARLRSNRQGREWSPAEGF